jgi:hypothetical protein
MIRRRLTRANKCKTRDDSVPVKPPQISCPDTLTSAGPRRGPRRAPVGMCTYATSKWKQLFAWFGRRRSSTVCLNSTAHGAVGSRVRLCSLFRTSVVAYFQMSSDGRYGQCAGRYPAQNEQNEREPVRQAGVGAGGVFGCNFGDKYRHGHNATQARRRGSRDEACLVSVKNPYTHTHTHNMMSINVKS